MPSIWTFLDSPLGRNPRLLLRKVADRLKLRNEQAPLPTPPACEVVIPKRWNEMLRAWLDCVPRRPGLFPFNRVFNQEFDEALLLELCVKGPQHGARDLTGDIKLIWDYSRAHPLVLNAWADADAVDANTAFLQRWMSINQDTNGPAWTCAMDVAIRAVNWIVADALSNGALGRSIGAATWAGVLWQHGAATWQRLESRIIPSNHYLADLLGLVVIGSVFPRDAVARRWCRFARSEFPRALLSQTRRDGGLNEASLRYHTFVTEMALLCRLAIGDKFPSAAEERLVQMAGIVANYRDADGDVFPFGDDDSGRVLALDEATELGRAEILVRLAGVVLKRDCATAQSAVCTASGWSVQRRGAFVVAVEFGGVGLRGHGGHAHNDDLSICVEWNGHAVFVDPGSYIYTPDRAARNRFRSAFAHNTLVVDGREPRGLPDEPFFLPGADTAWPMTENKEEGGGCIFTRALSEGVEHQREVVTGFGEVVIVDRVTGVGRHHLAWRFHLHPDWSAQVVAGGFVLSRGGVAELQWEFAPAEVSPEIVAGEFSPGYGRVRTIQVCKVAGEFALPCRCTWKLRPLSR